MSPDAPRAIAELMLALGALIFFGPIAARWIRTRRGGGGRPHGAGGSRVQATTPNARSPLTASTTAPAARSSLLVLALPAGDGLSGGDFALVLLLVVALIGLIAALCGWLGALRGPDGGSPDSDSAGAEGLRAPDVGGDRRPSPGPREAAAHHDTDHGARSATPAARRPFSGDVTP